MRTFVDAAGTHWEVHEIANMELAIVPRRLLPHPEYADGWLLFRSERERRRIAPYPRDWHSIAEGDLEACCRNAVLVPERNGSYTSAFGRARSAPADATIVGEAIA